MYWVPGPGTKVRSDILASCHIAHGTSTKTWHKKINRENTKVSGLRFFFGHLAPSIRHSIHHHHQLSLHRRERNNGGDRNSGGSIAPPCIARWRWTLSNFIICLPSSESDPAGTSRAAARCWSASTQNNVSGTSRPSAHCIYF